MATQYSPKIVTNGLIMHLDAANPKSFPIRNTYSSLLNTTTWTLGSGGTTGFNQNGATAENERVSGTNPWGQTDIVWESRPIVEGGGDGGWNTDWFTIDPTKMYRFSVWVKRTSSTDSGTFYLGMYGNGDGARRMDNSAVEGNPYWHCGSGLTQNRWYLFVGHVYPHNTSYTGQHADTGFYYPNNSTKQGSINSCNIGSGDLKWSSNSTAGIHRTYHYYSNSADAHYHWFQPRVDVIDGTQPSIQDLVSTPTWKDLTGNGYNATFINSPRLSTDASGVISFNSTQISRLTIPINLSSGTQTVIGAARYTSGTHGRIISALNNNWLLGHWSAFTDDHYAEGWVYSPTSDSSSNWFIYAATGDTGADNWKFYINGVKKAENNGGSQGPNTIQINGVGGTSEPSDGQCAFVMAYNRVLSDSEVLQNYNTLRGRFGL